MNINLDKLNEMQKKAALCTEGPLLILAGAGSGKTNTMTHRIAYMTGKLGVRPGEIFAVTFTNKAAAEMRERVERLAGSVSGMWIATFHSACLKILRMEGHLLGYSKDFTVYDPQDQRTVIKRILKEKNFDDRRFSPNSVLGQIGKAKERNQDAGEYGRKEGHSYPESVIAEIYHEYEKVLKSNNAMDFDDLLMNTVRLFIRFPEVLEKYQKRFKYIMVDEYQDTNHLQYLIVKMLAQGHRNICVVGDDDQSIYQWRGADIRNILDFEKDFSGTKVIKLEENYRSSANILEGANSVIKNNIERKAKKLWTSKEAGEKIRYFRLGDDKEEASYTASEISRLINQSGGKYSYKDFAVLYRNNAQSRRFEEAFIRSSMAYKTFGSLRYYERKEIKDMLSYMRLVANPGDDLAFERIINEPRRGVGEKSLEKMKALAKVKESSLLELIFDDEIYEGLSAKASQEIGKLAETMSLLIREKSQLKIIDIYNKLLVGTDYLKALEEENTVEAEGRIENLMEFKTVIMDAEEMAQLEVSLVSRERDIYEEAETGAGAEGGETLTLSSFLENMVLLAEEINTGDKEDYINLMTMHSAKGLEFPVVFMTGMEEELFPGRRSWEDPKGIEEERRLCYVGMTRAMEKLYLLSAEYRTLYGKADYTSESQFIREIVKTVLEGDPPVKRKKNRFLEDGYSKEIIKPFDGLAYSKKETKDMAAKIKNMEGVFKAGDSVSHEKFGKGKVIEAQGVIVTVIFDSVGTKKLAVGLAPLRKL